MSTHRLGQVGLSIFTWAGARVMDALMLVLIVRGLGLKVCGCRDGARVDVDDGGDVGRMIATADR